MLFPLLKKEKKNINNSSLSLEENMNSSSWCIKLQANAPFLFTLVPLYMPLLPVTLLSGLWTHSASYAILINLRL